MSTNLANLLRLWWANRPLAIKGLIVVGVPILALLASVASWYVADGQAREVGVAVTRDREAHLVLTRLEGQLLYLQGRLERYLESHEQQYFDELTAVRGEIQNGVAQVAAVDEDAQPQVAHLQVLLDVQFERIDRLIAEGARLAPSVERELDAGTIAVRDFLRTWQLVENREIAEHTVRLQAVLRRIFAVMAGSLVLGVLGGGLGVFLFSGGITRRTRRLEENTRLLAQRLPLRPLPTGHDEIGRVGRSLVNAAAILDQSERELRKSEVALRQALQDAEQASRDKSHLLSRMSHELRTPLNVILGFGQLLEMDSLTSDQTEGIGHILKAGRHLLALIDEVLDIARIDADRLTLSVEPVNVRDTLVEAVNLVRPLAEERGIGIDIDPTASDTRYVLADHRRLTQVLLNVLSNAVKFNRDGGRAIIGCEAGRGNRLRILVRDTGYGIPSELVPRLFAPFERLGAEEMGVGGVGLGLALSKGLIEAMGGTIGVESTVGKGSTFWLELERVR